VGSCATIAESGGCLSLKDTAEGLLATATAIASECNGVDADAAADADAGPMT